MFDTNPSEGAAARGDYTNISAADEVTATVTSTGPAARGILDIRNLNVADKIIDHSLTAALTAGEAVKSGPITAAVTPGEIVEAELFPTMTTDCQAAKVSTAGSARDANPYSAKGWAATKEFLSKVVPWPRDDPGYVNLHYSIKNKEAGKKDFVTGRPFRDIEKFLNFAVWASNADDIKEIWYCMSLQAEAGTNKAGKPKAVRRHQNTRSLKSLWADVDVKDDDKHYQSVEEAEAAVSEFCEEVGLPLPSAVVKSGGGLHIYWISDRALTPAEWAPYAQGLKSLLLKHGVKCDAPLTTDDVRLLRVPSTMNYKYDPPRPVELLDLPLTEYDFEERLAFLRDLASTPTAPSVLLPPKFAGAKPIFTGSDSLSDAIERADMLPLPLEPIAKGCAFIREALETGGKGYSQPMWNLTTLAATFMEDGHRLAHGMGRLHSGYTAESTEAMYSRKLAERTDRGIGWPSCAAIQANGCGSCSSCPHFAAGKSPLNLAYPIISPTEIIPPSEPSFADPYAEFVGAGFPLDVLPPVLVRFVNAEHQAMGADPSAIAMAALAAVAGAMHAETQVSMGEGWWEKAIVWALLLGQPSAMKSPIIDKVTKPLTRIDHARDKQWRQEQGKWLQNKQSDKTLPCPPRPNRCVINDVTPEKVAELLSRGPSGSLMVHDELAGWLGNFERYNSGSSARALFLSSWNGGTFLKDRVGNGKHDADAEIRVDNLALCILGGIQPDRLGKLGDLTSDGLLQRFLIVMMKAAELTDPYHSVSAVEAEYEKLIISINSAPPQNYRFDDDAFEVRDRVIHDLHKLEMVDGFPSALIGAIGKLKGYFGRICLVLQVSRHHDPLTENIDQPPFTRAEGERLRKLLRLELSDCLSKRRKD